MREELEHLIQAERPRLTALPSDDKSRSALPSLDQKIAILGETLQSAEIVQPPVETDGKIRFGATVKVRDRKGEPLEYRIVGIDETDLDKNFVSWRSPIARALLNSRKEQKVKFRIPSGEEEFEVLDVSY